MRLIVIGGGLALLASTPLEVAAQGRVVVPIVVNRPAAAGSSDTRILIEGPARVGGVAGPGTPAGGASVPSPSREIRIQTRDGSPASPPVVGGPRETRVTIEPVPGSAGQSNPARTQGAASIPAYSRETRVTVQEEGGGRPTTTREIRIFSNGSRLETPIIIAPE
ncbi:MAG TPA: hypothetical protein VGX21_05935 [Methylomirabilota bacterium]|nr:hypothetical protein [Methylomirabilota bacterium]